MWQSIYCIFLIMKMSNCEPEYYIKSKKMSSKWEWNYPLEKESFIFENRAETINDVTLENNFDRQDKDYITENFKPNNLKINGIPGCANGLTYCESIQNYPYRQLEEILRSNFINREFFENEDLIPNWRNSYDEEQVCKSMLVNIVPMAAKNINNEWKYIINSKDRRGFKQEVEIEVCKLTRATDVCGYKVLDGYVTRCMQRYLYRPLLSFSDDGQVSYDIFKLPSACSCTYIQNSIFDFRNDKKRRKHKKQ